MTYFLELDNGNKREWIWVSADSFTTDATKVGVPTTTSFEQNLSNLTVLSNVPSVTNGSFATGNMEFWRDSYSPTANSGIGGNSAEMDFDDTPAGTCCYGSMQLHNHATQQTLFAWNRWSVAGGNDDLGIGTHSAGNSDWTYAQSAGNWTTRTLHAFVRPTAAVNDTYGYTPGMQLTIDAASGVLANDNGGLTAALASTPANGTVVLNSDGSFTFDGQAVGSQTFTYRVSDGHTLSTTGSVTLQPSASAKCLVETTGDNVTDAASADASALRNAVQAASAGATIRVAGTCAGVIGRSVLTIDKAITLDGGRTPSNWTLASNPSVNQATIDGLNAGVPISITASGDLTAQGLIVTKGLNDDALGGGGIQNHGRLTLRHSTIHNNRVTNNVTGAGGGIYSNNWVSMTHVTIEANNANQGGGVTNYGGTLLIDRSVIVGNDRGGIFNTQRNYTGITGTLYMVDSVVRNNTFNAGVHSDGDATIDRSAIVKNEAVVQTGGIHNAGQLTVTNSTVSGNQTLDAGGSVPSGIYLANYENRRDMGFHIHNTTIVSNTAPNHANVAAVYYRVSSFYPLKFGMIDGTVIANNDNAACRGRVDFDDVTFSVTGANNIASDATCGFTTSADVKLAPLPNPTANTALQQVHTPQTGSPLIDAGGSCGLAADQRGVARDTLCDIGAVEVSSTTTQTACPNAATTLTNPTHNATLQIPVGAVAACQEIAFAPRTTTSGSAPADWQFIGNSFLLDASSNDAMLLNPTFAQPLQLTLGYSDAQIGSLTENDLTLYYYNPTNGQWVDAATTCSPTSTYVRDTVNNTLTVNICHFTEFVLASKPPAPHTFTGSVQFDGSAAADGTIIKAIVTNGTDNSEYTTTTSGGNYSLSVIADNPSTTAYDGGVSGNAITFLVGNFQANQSATFSNGANSTLNLTAATNLVVSSLADTNDGNFLSGNNTLREALANAPANATITFDPSIANGTITVGSTYNIAKNVTISASVPITLSGGSATRIMEVSGGSVTLNGLTLANGSAIVGGAVYVSSGMLTVERSTLIGNTATSPWYGGGRFLSTSTQQHA